MEKALFFQFTQLISLTFRKSLLASIHFIFILIQSSLESILCLYKTRRFPHKDSSPFTHNMATKRTNISFLVCLLVMILDIAAGILGIEAEIAQNKVHHLRAWILECRDPSYRAFKLGMAAVVLLIMAHVIANLLGGCIYIRSKEELNQASPNKQLAAASLILSWIMLGVAFTLLISGTLSNSRSRKGCGIAHHRLLSIGGILCFIHGLFMVAYYVSAAAFVREEHKQSERGRHENKPNQLGTEA